MKPISVILSTVLLLPALWGHAAGFPDVAARDTLRIETARTASNLSDEEYTRANFYNFIHEDIHVEDDGPEPVGPLYYTGFSNENRAYTAILNFIFPGSARLEFDRRKRYESGLIEVVYSEHKVRGGFARLTVRFKDRGSEKNYEVVFRKR